MKIIDNPAVGIGFLLCVGLAVLGFSLIPSAEGQNRTSRQRVTVSEDVTQDDVFSRRARPPFSPMVTTDEYEDPFADAVKSRRVLQGLIDGRERRPVFQPKVSGVPQASEYFPLSQAEKRDLLLHRIAEQRLRRGEFEKLPPLVSQMKNPEMVIKMMLDFAELSRDENIGQLLDIATELTLQIGQPGSATSPPQVPLYQGSPNVSAFPGVADPNAMAHAFAPQFQIQLENNVPLPLGAVPEIELRRQSQAMSVDVMAGPIMPQVVTVIEGTGTTEGVSQDKSDESQEQSDDNSFFLKPEV